MHPKKEKVNMKKIIYVLLAGIMLLIPEVSYAKTYSLANVSNSVDPDMPRPSTRPHHPLMPAFNPIVVSINEDLGNLYILFNRSIEEVHISISGNGTIIDENCKSVMAGQTVIFNLGNYEEGQYTLTIESNDEVLSQYIIFIDEE